MRMLPWVLGKIKLQLPEKKKLIKGELQHHLIIYSSLIEQFLVIFLKHFSFTEEVGSKFIPETDVLIMCSLMFQTE